MNNKNQENDKNRGESRHGLDPTCEKYLWEPTSTADPDLEKLEQLLSPMRLDPDRLDDTQADWARQEPNAASAKEGRPTLLWGLVGLGGLAAAAVWAGVLLLGQPAQEDLEDSQQVSLTTESGQSLLASSVYVAKRDGDRLLLGKDGRLADLELTRGSRLAVRSLAREKTVLALREGEMDAFVTAEAQPGFFNVDTPSTRCVDLGCQYRLRVDKDGKAHVRVLLGRVAFRDERKSWRKEVFVPQGAHCTADPTQGSGTPRYDDIRPTLARLLDEFDALPGKKDKVRRELALSFIAQAEGKEDMLPVWHFLQDLDHAISRSAAGKLRATYGILPGLKKDGKPTEAAPVHDEERSLWREHLWPDPYR